MPHREETKRQIREKLYERKQNEREISVMNNSWIPMEGEDVSEERKEEAE